MSSIPESSVQRQYHPITLGELFETDEHGEPKLFNSDDDRASTQLEYRIPEHQRYPAWSQEKKSKLLDSVFRNYTMSGFVVSEHFDITNGEKYYDFEDGQTRLTILQSFYNNKLPFISPGCSVAEGLYYDDLSHVQQQRFNRYKISLEILSRSKNKDNFYDDIQIMFERLQEGKALSDDDKYWNRKTKHLVKFTHDNLLSYETGGNAIIHNVYMSPQGYGDKKRMRLGHMCGFISGIINGKDYITSCFAIQCLGRQFDRHDFPNGMLDLEITSEAPSAVAPSAVAPSAVAPSAVAQSAVAPSAVDPSAVAPSGSCKHQRYLKIKNFFEYYYQLIDRVYDGLPIRTVDDSHPIWNYLQTNEDQDISSHFNRREQMKKWYSLSGSEGGMILWDYLNQDGKTLDEKMDMWVEIIHIGRISRNFLTGARSLYNGLRSADKQNTHSENYQARVSRIKDFYYADDRTLYSEEKGIVWQQLALNV